jgi:hypothetical protein
MYILDNGGDNMYIVVNAATGEAMSSTTYPTAQEAIMARTLYIDVKTRIQRVVDDSWMIREAARLADGTYRPLPDFFPTMSSHFAHWASDNQRVAFTESPEKGMDDKQLVLDPATYISRFFGAIYKPHEIRDLSYRLLGINESQRDIFRLSCSEEDFIYAYTRGLNVKSESSLHVSCMAKPASYFGTDDHPASVYATGETPESLSIAYTIDPDDPDHRVTARAVVWPYMRRFVRVYGDDEQFRYNLVNKLESMGYERGSDFSGAILRVKTISRRSNIVLMPYIDGDAQFVDGSIDSEFFTITDRRRGAFAAASTGGQIQLMSCACDHCGNGMDEDDSYDVDGERWCESCYETDTTYCEYYDESYNNNVTDFVTVIRRRRHHTGSNYEQTWSQGAADDYAFHCENTDQWYSSNDFTQIDVTINTNGRTQTWCHEETTDDWFCCDDCGDYFHNDLRADHDEADICIDCHAANKANNEPQPNVPHRINDDNQLELELELGVI